MTDRTAEMVEVIAREIWRYNECPWNFDAPDEGMAQLQKQIAVDQAKGIVVALAKKDQERAKRIARFVMTDANGWSRSDTMIRRICPLCGAAIEPFSVIGFIRIERAWWNLWRGRPQWVHDNCIRQ